ncbi:glycoside hydrolase family 31 protein [Edaphobacter acidisoli]|nr:TIM-barrel domain-containing protein [Edaphobacter acidisoli]
MRLSSQQEAVDLVFCTPEIVHITTKPAGPVSPPGVEPWLVSACKPSTSKFEVAEGKARIESSALIVSATLSDGALTFSSLGGSVLLQESHRFARRYTPVEVGGQSLYKVSDRFDPGMAEGFYGLGQHQSGVFNYRGSVIELAQTNSDIAIPLLLSSNGYGVLWNTASRSLFDNRFQRELKLTADATSGIDYYFLYGPDMDAVIHHYRMLTGDAPLLPRWAYGFIQSKDRYTSAAQLQQIAAEYRAQHVPLDMIVQDWFWWKKQGDPEYTDEYLKPNPDVPGALRELHDSHVHAIISTWAMLDTSSDAYREMRQQHFLIPGTPVYDATNPKARDFYWNHLIHPLFEQGWDGFWLDSSEPEIWGGESDRALEDKTLSIGPGARYLNVFPLMHTGNVYQHWRGTMSPKRVFILTRSAFAGQQRNSTVEWSGDIATTFSVLKRQIPAGLNFAISGMPYWTTDVGGYFGYEPDDPAYQETYTRWFEYGTFCPILRTHGHRKSNELFSYGSQTPTLISYDKLRERLVPYIYSLAWRVTHDDYTIQRPLVMDWRQDERVRDIADEFMFGPALLVAPVTDQGSRQRLVYLPTAEGWYDFWTGDRLNGGQQILAQAPLDRIPLYVRAGSILPLGPAREYVEQAPDAPIVLRIFPGADGNFNLYNDAGDGYNYEKGEYAITPIHWHDATRTLEIGARQGSYVGMPRKLSFHIVVVRPGYGTGPDPSAQYLSLDYDGTPTHITVP